MKLLLDQGLPRSSAKLLQEHGIEAVHVGDIGLSTASDTDIISRADKDGCIIVTLDADFHALLAVNELSSPSVIRIRIEGLDGSALYSLICKVLDKCKDNLEEGAVVSVQGDRIGVRLLPIGK